MRKLAILLFATAASLGVAVAQTTDRPLTSFPYTPGLDVSSMDPAADPCVDFYQYTCGGWVKNNPIPADQPRWSVYGKLTLDNQRYLWGVLEDLAGKNADRNATQQKIGDYFAACMDEPASKNSARTPIRHDLARIAALKSKRDLAPCWASCPRRLQYRSSFSGSGRTRTSPIPRA